MLFASRWVSGITIIIEGERGEREGEGRGWERGGEREGRRREGGGGRGEGEYCDFECVTPTYC